MFFLDRNFVFGLLCTLKLIENLKSPPKTKNVFQKTYAFSVPLSWLCDNFA